MRVFMAERPVGAAAGKNRGGEHIVRYAMGGFGQHVGCGGCYDQQVRLIRQGHVLHMVLKIRSKRYPPWCGCGSGNQRCGGR